MEYYAANKNEAIALTLSWTDKYRFFKTYYKME